MNNEEAKLILQAYRPGGQDADDPQFHEALAQAQRDPELARWFATEHALDACISARVKAAIKPPEHLKSQLLAQRKIMRPLAWWQVPAWRVAAIAAALLITTLTVFWNSLSAAPRLEAFEQAMVQNSMPRADHLNFRAQDLAQINDWVKTQHGPADFVLPAALRNAPVHGCRVLDWAGRKVTLLCFMPGDHDHADLFVIDGTHFRDVTPSETAQFVMINGVVTAIWCRQDKTYLLAGNMSEKKLREML